DFVIADIDGLRRAWRDDPLADIIVGIDAEIGPADSNDTRDALHLLDDHLTAADELAAGNIVDLQDMIALVAGIGSAGVNGLGVDHRRADDEADRHSKLRDDESGPKPTGPWRICRRSVRL